MVRFVSGEFVSFVLVSIIFEYNLGFIIKILEIVFNIVSVIMFCIEVVDIMWMGSDKVECQDCWVVFFVGFGIWMLFFGERFMICFG